LRRSSPSKANVESDQLDLVVVSAGVQRVEIESRDGVEHSNKEQNCVGCIALLAPIPPSEPLCERKPLL